MAPSTSRPLGLSRLGLSRARIGEIMRFGLTSALSASVTLGLPILLHERFRIDPRLAVAIAFVLVFVMNFLTTRYFVFRSTGDARVAFQRFLLSSIVFRSCEYAGFLWLFALGLPYFVAQFIIVGISFVLKFLTLKRFVFKAVPPDSIA